MKNIARENKLYEIMIKGTIHQEVIKIPCVFILNNKASFYSKRNLTEIKISDPAMCQQLYFLFSPHKLMLITSFLMLNLLLKMRICNIINLKQFIQAIQQILMTYSQTQQSICNIHITFCLANIFYLFSSHYQNRDTDGN